MPFFAGPLATPKSPEHLQYLLAVHLALLLSDTRNPPQFGDGLGPRLAKSIKRRVVHHHKRSRHLLTGHIPSPLPQEFPQLFIHPHGWIHLKSCFFEGPAATLAAARASPRCVFSLRQPVRQPGAYIANPATLPLGRLPKMSANLFLPAFFPCCELLHLVIPPPSMLFFSGILNLVDEESP